METGHIGRLIRYERIRKGISGESVCRGICDLNIYDKIENENYSVDIHIVRFVLQRLGMGADMLDAICAEMSMMKCRRDLAYWNF